MTQNKQLATSAFLASTELKDYFMKCRQALKENSVSVDIETVKDLKALLKTFYEAMLIVTSKHNFKSCR